MVRVIFLGMENEISIPFEPPPTDGQDAVYDDVAWDSSPIVCLAILISIIVFFLRLWLLSFFLLKLLLFNIAVIRIGIKAPANPILQPRKMASK